MPEVPTEIHTQRLELYVEDAPGQGTHAEPDDQRAVRFLTTNALTALDYAKINQNTIRQLATGILIKFMPKRFVPFSRKSQRPVPAIQLTDELPYALAEDLLFYLLYFAGTASKAIAQRDGPVAQELLMSMQTDRDGVRHAHWFLALSDDKFSLFHALVAEVARHTTWDADDWKYAFILRGQAND
ncbi:hypothetical protein BDW74DRAFT_183648 [Aspergillus multicolor]|uniref:uncharacterized protein n=1 Tax=Aspergillus multicolor TaxID=41759 RepID=UPI003CCD4684